MLHCVHQLVSDCVCLLFCAGQVEYSRFLLLFHWQQLPAAADSVAMRIVRVNLNSKVVRLLNNELRLTIKAPHKLSEATDLGNRGDPSHKVTLLFAICHLKHYQKTIDYSWFYLLKKSKRKKRRSAKLTPKNTHYSVYLICCSTSTHQY